MSESLCDPPPVSVQLLELEATFPDNTITAPSYAGYPGCEGDPVATSGAVSLFGGCAADVNKPRCASVPPHVHRSVQYMCLAGSRRGRPCTRAGTRRAWLKSLHPKADRYAGSLRHAPFPPPRADSLALCAPLCACFGVVSRSRGAPASGGACTVRMPIGPCSRACPPVRASQMVFAPLEEEVTSRHNFVFHLRPDDLAIPICHEGMNRSQLMYLALHGAKRGHVHPGNARIAVPHGAESGFDPYQAYADLRGDNVFGFLHGVCLPRGQGGDWVRTRSCVRVCVCMCVPVHM